MEYNLFYCREESQDWQESTDRRRDRDTVVEDGEFQAGREVERGTK